MAMVQTSENSCLLDPDAMVREQTSATCDRRYDKHRDKHQNITVQENMLARLPLLVPRWRGVLSLHGRCLSMTTVANHI